MKLKTKVNITFNDWLSQASRFTRGNDVLAIRNIPQNTETSGPAEIIVNMTKPLIQGFEADIIYRQNYTKQVTQPKSGQELSDNPETETVTVNNYIDVIKYKATRSFTEINGLIHQINQANIGASKSLVRLKENVLTAILLDVLQHQTFKTTEFPNGLPKTQYESII